jgi:hypothetical protein
VFGVERLELDSFRGLALELFHHDLAVFRFHDNAIALAHRCAWRDDDDVTGAVRRLHRVARNLQRIGMLVGDRREGDLVPAFAHRKAAVVEKSTGASLRKSNQRHVLHGELAAVGDQRHEDVELGAGRLQRFGNRLCRWPPLPSFRRDALGLVERRRVEAGFLGKPRWRQFGAGGEPVDRRPDLVVGEHGHGRGHHRDCDTIS